MCKCGRKKERGFRFCGACLKEMEQAMKATNYLTQPPLRRQFRPPGSAENRHQTRSGVDE